MKIIIIAALTEKGAIARNGKMPWHIPEELKHFKETTTGYPVLMGGKTFEAIGKPLSGRLNIVLSRKKNADAKENLYFFDNLSDALNFAERKLFGRVYVIGGESIFRQTIDLADELVLSFIKKEYDGDKFFPIEKIEDFELLKTKHYEEFTVKRYVRK